MTKFSGKIVIDAGEDFEKVFKFRNTEGDPIDFTDLETFEMAFPAADGTAHKVLFTSGEPDEELEYNATLDGDAMLGKMRVVIAAENTLLLKRMEGQTVEASFVIDGVKTVVILEKILEVRKPAFV
jgi:hypothetical protein